MAWFWRRRRNDNNNSTDDRGTRGREIVTLTDSFGIVDDPLGSYPPFLDAPPTPPDTWDGALRRIAALESRVEALGELALTKVESPTYDDLVDVRTHSAKVAAELARLEVNLAARLDVVRDRLRALEQDGAAEVVDLRPAANAPTDTGWPVPLTG